MLKNKQTTPLAMNSSCSVTYTFWLAGSLVVLLRSHSVAEAGLKFTLQPRMASNSQRYACFCFLSAEVKGLCHHAWLLHLCEVNSLFRTQSSLSPRLADQKSGDPHVQRHPTAGAVQRQREDTSQTFWGSEHSSVLYPRSCCLRSRILFPVIIVYQNMILVFGFSVCLFAFDPSTQEPEAGGFL